MSHIVTVLIDGVTLTNGAFYKADEATIVVSDEEFLLMQASGEVGKSVTWVAVLNDTGVG